MTQRILQISSEVGSSTFEIPGGISTIGRVAGNNLVLESGKVSRRHAQIDCTEMGCTITDLESSNGTLLNGDRLTPHVPYPLNPGAVIQIDIYTLTYSEIEPPPPPEPDEEPLPSSRSSTGSESDEGPVEVPFPEHVEGNADVSDAEPAEVQADESPAAPVESAKPPQDSIETIKKEPKKRSTAAVPPSRGDGGSGAPVIPANGAGELVPPGLDLHSRKLIQYLPGIYHTDFMSRFLAIFEAILIPIQWNVDNFDLYLDTDTTPSGFLPWLASWFEVSFHHTWTEAQRRQLLKEAHRIYARRGTPWALSRVLEIYTGRPPQIIDTAADLDPFTFRVRLPLKPNQVNIEVVQSIIDASKPAHTTYLLEFSS